MNNVYTFKTKVTTKGNALKNSLSRRTKKSAKSQENRFFDVLIN